MTIGLGIIGTGKHGSRYLRHCRDDVPQVHVAALSRRDRTAGEAQAAELGCRYHAEFTALIEDPAVDAVVAVVPASLHEAICAAAAAARKPLLLEKPAAISVEVGQRMAARAAAAGITVMVAHTLRFNAVVNALRTALPAIGELCAAGLSQRFEPSRLAWLDDPARAGGGIALHTGVHSFDLLHTLTGGRARRVSAFTRTRYTRAAEDEFAALVEIEDPPLLATISGARTTAGRSGLIEIAGRDGQLVGDHTHHWAWHLVGTEKRPLPLSEPTPTVREVLRAFARCLHEGTPPPISLDDGLRAVALAEACYRSVRRGSTVEVPTY